MTDSLEKVYQGDCSVNTHYSVGGSAAKTLASGRPWAVRLFETGISAQNQIQRVQWRYFAPLRARPEGGPTWSRVQRIPQQVGFKRTEPDFNDSSSCPKRRCSRAITTAACPSSKPGGRMVGSVDILRSCFAVVKHSPVATPIRHLGCRDSFKPTHRHDCVGVFTPITHYFRILPKLGIAFKLQATGEPVDKEGRIVHKLIRSRE